MIMAHLEPELIKKKNLILISRPIDFLFALEVCKNHPKKFFLILVYPNNNNLEKKAIKFLYEEFGKDFTNARFKFFTSPFKKDFLNLIYFKLFLFLKFRNSEHHILSTSGGPKGRLVFKRLNPEKIILTDEGTFSLKRIPEIFENSRLFVVVRKGIFTLIYRMLGVNDLKVNKDFEILTMFHECAEFNPKVSLTCFEHWKKIIDEREYEINNSEIIVLGSVPGPMGIGGEEYQARLERAYLDNPSFEVKLKPHKDFPENFGYEELEADMPIEYFLIRRKSIPKKIYCFNSTSFFILSLLFPEIELEKL